MSRRREPRWLTVPEVRMLHAETLSLFGGHAGVRDEGLLESAVASPRNHFGYQPDATLFDLAAILARSLSKNHSFIDGNKRVALLAIRSFLYLNGYRFKPDVVETVTMMEGLAAGDVTVEQLTRWIGRASVKIDGPKT